MFSPTVGAPPSRRLTGVDHRRHHGLTLRTGDPRGVACAKATRHSRTDASRTDAPARPFFVSVRPEPPAIWWISRRRMMRQAK